MTNDWFGEARGTLASLKADEAGWDALMALALRGVEALGAERFVDMALPYLEQHAARWDDDLRSAALRWGEDDEAMMAPDDPRWALVRVFLHAHGEGWRLARGGRLIVTQPAEAPPDAHGLDALEVQLGLPIWNTAQTIRALPAWARSLTLTQHPYNRAPLPAMALEAPLEALELRGFSHAHEPLGPWLANPAMRFGAPRFKTLRLVGCDLDEAGMVALGPGLAGVEELSLERCRVGKSGLWMLAESGALAHVKRLGLRHLNALWDTGLEELALCDKLGALEALDLRQCELTSRGARYLAQAPWRRGLKELDLRDNRIGPEGMALLAEALPAGCRVRAEGCWGAQLQPGSGVLRVEADSVTPAMMREIVRVAQQHKLTTLHILPRRMDRAALQVLWESALPYVERISLKSLELTTYELGTMAEWPIAGQIVSLDLTDARGLQSDTLANDLARFPALEAVAVTRIWGGPAGHLPRGLHTVRMRSCYLETRHLHALIRFAAHVKHLDVSDNDLHAADLAWLRAALPGAEVIG